jgi:ABC-type Fe3+-hydroxamate transport system substrate-binding protein
MGILGIKRMAIESNQSARLDRIEDKIDKLAEAMVAIARAEEKLSGMEQKYMAQYDRMNRFSEKLDTIEDAVRANASTVMMINKVIGGAVIAIIGALATQYFM